MTTLESTTAPTAKAVKTRSTFLRDLLDSAGMFLVFLLLFAIVSIFVPSFASLRNMSGLLLSVTTVGIIACTMLFCLAAGDFDLSIGSIVALSGVIAALVINSTHSAILAMLAGTIAGAVVGVCNGLIIARVGINALIATLASMQIVRGIEYILSDNRSIGIGNTLFLKLGVTTFFGLSLPIWIMLVFFILFGVLLRRTTFGRNTLAIGGNAEAARLAGISVIRTKVIIFAMQGLVSGFAGVILASRLCSSQPQNGTGLELQVISACVLGGVSLTGGVGTMIGVVAGVLIMGTLNDAMNLMNIDSNKQLVITGSVLLAAVLIDKLKHRRS